MISNSERQAQIKTQLTASERPISASAFAKKFGVSRQSIVGDVALLRAQGEDIVATPRGYEYQQTLQNTAVLAVQHTPEQMGTELLLLVDAGVQVLNVIVDHPVYGELRGELMLKSANDVQHFIRKVTTSQAHLLSELTQGVHLHTIAFDDVQQLTHVRDQLKAAGFLYEG
ncbi:transcription repressor NadR [Lacticaseibacillus brantae]|uniref:Transcriptional regulator n=1 Tax=Lacticaseibacillus brantae DSM 23927 TaxID=1423727 RepID=A0A0R2B847_9LACO|nr:transcription repressor NadR [Lacticaseibacillus brantae]KRM71692.1 transcriptional regulator [Lacticaseibacillus brantae DSM 23927]